MLYITTALYLEASPFIKEFGLKKNRAHTRFEVFESEDITLVITGVSELQAAIALTYVFTIKNPTAADCLLNFGFCGSLIKEFTLGELVLCNKLISQGSSRACYPDLPPRHPFQEASILSSKTIITKELTPSLTASPRTELIDMEAYGIYQAALHFLSQHQMFFLKMVSDYPNEGLSAKDVTARAPALLAEGIRPLLSWCRDFLLVSRHIGVWKESYTQDFEGFSEEIWHLLHQIEERLSLTTSMTASLRQHLLYANCLKRPIKILLQDFLARKEVSNCKSKVEGKQYVCELKQLLRK